ncbi:GAF and ANTAR domain-containing protein [Luteimicrobium sp. DT211]|uniref:GAF and ANTAR domain-containing protein n=1 Tax=Luteimicrobium sp. DT211 TaxID=3393412 RepID=UPI003CED5050
MTRTPAQALAAATAALLEEHEAADVVERVLQDVVRLLAADAAAVLLDSGRGLELFVATSHRAEELEVHQAQNDEGPCVDAVQTGVHVTAASAAELESRWPTTGPTIARAGFASVDALPLRWHGRALGGLNVFSEAERGLGSDEVALAQSFADVVTLVVVQSADLDDTDVLANLRHALGGRVVVEQAKGVLAQQLDVGMAEAYDALLSKVGDDGSLTAVARAVVEDAYRA